MTSLISWIAPAVISSLGWALLHFLWQGAAIAALASFLMQLCRRPQARYVIGVASLIVMLAALPLTFFFLNGAPLAPLPVFTEVFPGALPLPPANILPWLVQAWIAGVLLLSLRFTGSFLALEKTWRNQSSPPNPRLLLLCHDVQQRLGITRSIRYLECRWLEAPAGFGALRPVILLPVALLTGLSEEQLRAVIAHELAHIRRWDFAVNLFQIAVGTLLFYHPAVWWLNRRIRATREICCDEVAVTQCANPVEYARALALLAEGRDAPALAMAINHGLLTGRIRLLLGGGGFDARIFAAGMAASLFLLIAALAGGNLFAAGFQPAPAPVQTAQVIAAPQPQMHMAAHLLKHKITHVLKHQILAGSVLPAPVSSAAPAQESDDPPADVSPSASIIPVSDDAPEVVEIYPAAVLSIMAPRVPSEWERNEASNYCDTFAQQTVRQGAIKPLVVDDAAKARYGFFYSRCMLRNGEVNGQDRVLSPVYAPLGVSAPDHAANASGSWAISFSPFPPSWSCNFTQGGNVLDGNCARSQGGGAAHGVVDGQQIRWRWVYLDDEKLQVELDFIGVIGADGAISGLVIPRQNTGLIRQIQPFTARPGPLSTQVASGK